MLYTNIQPTILLYKHLVYILYCYVVYILDMSRLSQSYVIMDIMLLKQFVYDKIFKFVFFFKLRIILNS